MLHLTPTKREQMAIDRDRAKAWLHTLDTYRNREYGKPTEPDPPRSVVIAFPNRIEAES